MAGRIDVKGRIDTATMRFVARRTGPGDYGVAGAAVLVAAAIRTLVSQVTAVSPYFQIFFPAVLIAALVGGGGPGVCALLLAAGVVWWTSSPLLHRLPADHAEVVTLVMFMVTGGLMVITAQATRRAVRRAIAAEERFRQVLDSSLDAFCMFEPIRDAAGVAVDFRWSHANPAAEALAPLGARPLLGRRLLDVFPDAAELGQLQRYQHLLATGKPDQIEFRRPIDGADRWLRSTGVKVGDAVAVTFREITESVEARRRLEAQFEARTRELEESRQAAARTEAALAQAQRLETVGRLTGGVAHDFNNLLTVIVSGLDMILRAPDKPERVMRLGRAALEAGRRGERLTRQLLTFSRSQEVKLEVTEIAPALAAMEMLIRRAAGEQVTLTIGVADGVGAARLDAAQLEAALLNLVVNAAHATPPGGSIGVRARRTALRTGQVTGLEAGDYVAISVADTGAGMAPEVLDRVFEPFFTTKEVGKGSGLGLAQVYGFARHCGGLATVDSAPGQGATVTLYLPSVGEPAAETAPAAAESKLQLPFATGATVLLAEDDIDVRLVTETLLTEFGCHVLTAADGPSALMILHGREPLHLLLSDVVMPGGMSGPDLARAAADIRPGLPILLATGYGAGRLPDLAADAPWPVLRKPYRMDDLAQAVHEALTSSRMGAN